MKLYTSFLCLCLLLPWVTYSFIVFGLHLCQFVPLHLFSFILCVYYMLISMFLLCVFNLYLCWFICVYYLFTFSFPFYRFWSIGGKDQRSIAIKLHCFLLTSSKVYVCFTTLIKLLFCTFDLCLYQSTLSPFWFVLVLIYSFTLLTCISTNLLFHTFGLCLCLFIPCFHLVFVSIYFILDTFFSWKFQELLKLPLSSSL